MKSATHSFLKFGRKPHGVDAESFHWKQKTWWKKREEIVYVVLYPLTVRRNFESHSDSQSNYTRRNEVNRLRFNRRRKQQKHWTKNQVNLRSTWKKRVYHHWEKKHLAFGASHTHDYSIHYHTPLLPSLSLPLSLFFSLETRCNSWRVRIYGQIKTLEV